MDRTTRPFRNGIWFIFFAISLLFSTSYAFSAALELDEQTGSMGEVISFTLSVNAAPNSVFSLGLDIGFDPEILEFRQADATGGLMEKWAFIDFTSPEPGLLRIGAFDLAGFPEGTNGLLATLTFLVIGSQKSPITITGLVDDVSDWSVKPGLFVCASSNPLPDIRVNNSDGPLFLSEGTPVSVTVTLNPGNRIGNKADAWVVAFTPFGTYSYVYPGTWVSGIQPCIQFELIQIPDVFEVLNIPLPTGNYRFGFAIDDNADGILDATWWDIVDLHVD